MYFTKFVLYLSFQTMQVQSSPVLVPLASKLPANPIEEPADWAWGQHPANGLGYKAKDSLTVEVCLANPAMVNTAKCVLPLDVCLANPQHLSALGCSGNKYPLDVCLDNPQLLRQPSCSDNFSGSVCAQNPDITLTPACSGALENYEPTQPECMRNKKALCSLDLCGNFEFWKC
eukprot:TRINITY_DN24540_c0_g1_i1.p1 TRINITY_DN24540_c0_g1~~TRINITY_DN24540_c0_g1_i1.p1  ORF type:complete len:174 (-),score=42.64 TRINITY_DN24540_c0_g1_i1:39-560(-)